jgi:ATPase subunit of ABC transporter with duplicated ATPase domains
MVIVSHDREFLDNLCTKIVETERGVATTYKVCLAARACVCVWGGDI